VVGSGELQYDERSRDSGHRIVVKHTDVCMNELGDDMSMKHRIRLLWRAHDIHRPGEYDSCQTVSWSCSVTILICVDGQSLLKPRSMVDKPRVLRIRGASNGACNAAV
jgi:hypothetical protein